MEQYSRSKFLKTLKLDQSFNFVLFFHDRIKRSAIMHLSAWYNEFVLIVRNNFFRVPTNARELFIRIDQT